MCMYVSMFVCMYVSVLMLFILANGRRVFCTPGPVFSFILLAKDLLVCLPSLLETW